MTPDLAERVRVAVAEWDACRCVQCESLVPLGCMVERMQALVTAAHAAPSMPTGLAGLVARLREIAGEYEYDQGLAESIGWYGTAVLLRQAADALDQATQSAEVNAALARRWAADLEAAQREVVAVTAERDRAHVSIIEAAKVMADTDRAEAEFAAKLDALQAERDQAARERCPDCGSYNAEFHAHDCPHTVYRRQLDALQAALDQAAREVDGWKEVDAGWRLCVQTLQAERDALRAALVEIRNQAKGDPGSAVSYVAPWWLVEKADAALAPAAPGHG